MSIKSWGSYSLVISLKGLYIHKKNFGSQPNSEKEVKNMLKVKIGVFPGRVEEFVVEDGTTVKQALEMANITVSEEQEVKIDGTSASYEQVIPETASMLLVTKRIKGAC